MNKTDLVQIIQKRTIQLTVFSVVFVCAMVFLIPTLSEEVQANTGGAVYTSGGALFTSVNIKMDEGRFVPPFDHGLTRLGWQTAPSAPGGAEKGSVTAQINILGTALFSFNKPTSGEPTCSVRLASSQLEGSCSITGSDITGFVYEVKFKKPQSTNKYCDILTKLDGLSQLKIIKEKLQC